jgi:hypothetical protein
MSDPHPNQNPNGENEVTDFDRKVAEAVANMYPDDPHEPDYEWSASIRREVQSAGMYMQVYGLSAMCAQSLVNADKHERYALENDCMTPTIARTIGELRRLAWANSDDETMFHAGTDAFNAIHEERMKRPLTDPSPIDPDDLVDGEDDDA